jgi:hypothetical protein
MPRKYWAGLAVVLGAGALTQAIFIFVNVFFLNDNPVINQVRSPAMYAVVVVSAVLWSQSQGSRAASLRLQLSLNDSFSRAEAALTAIGGTVTRRDVHGGRLEADLPTSFRWGEFVRVALSGVDGDVVVQVRSSSFLPIATLIDFGKNAENVKRFLTALTR